MIKPIIAANWKMNMTTGESAAFAERLAGEFARLEDRDVIIAPPFTSLYPVAGILRNSGIHLAAQNLHWEKEGAFTGEISAIMLCDIGCRYVLVGHSERRTLFGERDEDVNKKAKTALAAGLKPIVCIGETLDQRESGRTFDILASQIKEGLNNLLPGDIEDVTIAYEPVWAIGTGKTATAEQAQEAHRFIRGELSRIFGEGKAGETAILYGGSVKPENIACLMDQTDINGALVGGASLDFESFAKIIKY
ncbi:MAG: triose-phosphate isomerase [Deltaproteobacteria bacterium]|nr:triose-phosphate isomerase [Deltaproteobacteria bacterium]